jgi:hypothetical protein
MRGGIRELKRLQTFQYKEPSGRDQGINVRQKSTTLVTVRAIPVSVPAFVPASCSLSLVPHMGVCRPASLQSVVSRKRNKLQNIYCRRW